MKQNTNIQRKNYSNSSQVSIIKDLSLFEYAIAISLIFAFAVTLML